MSFVAGEKPLTATNPGVDEDRSLLDELDLVPQAPRAACMAGAVTAAD